MRNYDDFTSKTHTDYVTTITQPFTLFFWPNLLLCHSSSFSPYNTSRKAHKRNTFCRIFPPDSGTWL